MSKFLITGGAGFIGSNYLHYVVNNYVDDFFLCIDDLTYAGNYDNIKELEKNTNFKFMKFNICDDKKLLDIFKREKFDYVVNFAAETHVDNSIKNPNIFFETNIMGTINLLNSVKFMNESSDHKIIRYHQVSTDEVYGELPLDHPELLFNENSKIIPSSPYSASKASADLITLAYHKTYNIPITISRCSNNYGPYQYPEKFIPLMIKNALNNKKIPIYGTGENIRDWIYVYDHIVAIDLIVRNGENGEVYNIGGNFEISNINVAKKILRCLNKSEHLISFVKDRPGHDKRYAIDSSKIKNKLGWKCQYNFDEGLNKTIDWYLKNDNRLL